MAVQTYNSEKALEDALNAGSISPDFILAKGGKFTAVEALWNPSKLASADRSLLSWWDARKDVTIDTGVSNLGDQGTGGLDFAQPTTSAQPTLSGSGASSLITYDGVADYLSQPVTADNFQNLTRFEWWGITYFDSTTIRVVFNIGDNGVNTDQFFMYSNAGNVFTITAKNNETTARGCVTDVAVSNGYHIVGVVCNGTAYSIYIDGALAGITTVGINNGKFIGDFTNKANYDIVGISTLFNSSQIFYPNKQKFDLCFGGTTDTALSTEAERTEIFNYINKEFALGL
jgi:hypothetical protein